MDQLISSIIQALNGTPPQIVIFLISLLPMLELRGGILAAGLLKVDMIPAFGICLLGTLLPIPFILLFFRQILNWLRNTRFVKIVQRFENRMEKKSKKIEKYKTFGLLLFVALPLPGTGAWTGAAAATLLNMRFLHSMASIIIGSLVADMIMCALSYGLLGQIW